ncbi:hypothetical protein BDF14DRAFT_1851756, partial [Spinellus fusiger]
MKYTTSLLMAIAGFCAISNVVKADERVIEYGSCVSYDEKYECSKQCAVTALQPMCVSNLCFCTNVGVGDCKENNNKGCVAICESMNLESTGCSDGECVC